LDELLDELLLDEFDELCESDVLDVFDMATSNSE